MSREKKSYVDDITKLRRILDNSLDPSLKNLITKNESALESVRRRLSGEYFMTYSTTDRFFRRSESMEPRVTIYAKTPISPRMVLPPPQIDTPMALPEFKLVSPSTTITSPPLSQICFDDEELFEVEKIDQRIPEFLEVIPKESRERNLETNTGMQDESTSVHESHLPEWQPVEEEPVAITSRIPEKHTQDSVPEFERIDLSESSDEIPSENWQISPKTEGQSVSSGDVTSESIVTSFGTLTKKQLRAIKKEQKRKEKEERRQRKFELKRLKKEQKRPVAPTTQEQPFFSPVQEEIPQEEEFIREAESSQTNLKYNNFKGIPCIDEKTAELLYKNGYFSIENLNEATIEDLVQIRGIRRKLAKQIKKEIDQNFTPTTTSEFIPAKEKKTKKKERKRPQDSTEWETLPTKEIIKKSVYSHICSYEGYTLYRKETRKQDGKQSPMYFFSKTKPEKAHAAPLPDGYRLAIHKKTGVPYLKKK